MSNALAKQEKSATAIAPNGIIPTDTSEAMAMAKFIYESRLAPRSFDSPQKIVIAILRGLEIGLPPFQALEGSAVINGKVCLYGDALPALVLRTGLCVKFEERIEGDGDNMTAVCITKRRGMENERKATFSVADAKRAGLWGKSGPWKQYPQRMLQMRARSWNFRDGFADALGGFGVVEESRDTVEQRAEREPFNADAAPGADPLLAPQDDPPAAENADPADTQVIDFDDSIAAEAAASDAELIADDARAG